MASKFPSSDKGYTFVDKVPDKFTCSICTEVLCIPRLTECCGQRFCQECLHSWLRNNWGKTCPHCRGQNFNHILDKSVPREIKQLKVYCSHREEGCQWVGQLGNVRTHLDSQQGCGYEEVDCPNSTLVATREPGLVFGKSSHAVKRKDLEKHITSLCPLRKYECIYCGLEDTYRFIQECHHGVCPNYPLECPNECGIAQIKRKDMSTHQSHCPLEPVQCPLQDIGCDLALPREDTYEYRFSHSHYHFQLIHQVYKTECNTLNEEIELLKRRNNLLKEKHFELESVCVNLLTRCNQLEEKYANHDNMLYGCCVCIGLIFVLWCILVAVVWSL